ncbi:MAG: class I SAM-dependent methyltransferase [Deltaproteobacteria bacterium]|nr:class I SAM-dependent methyltransferase [Deltaproteobacteria bacterium]
MNYQWITNNAFTQRYLSGEWRSPVFCDMVAKSLEGRHKPTILDIGCGNGFDGDEKLQASLAAKAAVVLGVEPDPTVELGSFFSNVYRCPLEEAPIAPNSVDVAYCNMVLEHVAQPQLFFKKLREVLKPGGIFWGFTVDSRHLFCKFSALMERTRIKDLYLTLLKGERGADRYLNYPTCYRANSPEQLEPFARDFHSIEFIRFHRPDVLNYYLPKAFIPLSELWNKSITPTQKPGYMLAIHLTK